MARHRVGALETVGLRPLLPALRGCLRALGGDPYAPASRADASSLAILKPRVSLPLWFGRKERRTPVYLLPNRRAFPYEGPRGGYDTRVRGARDFRGLGLTYASHYGTDFAIPRARSFVRWRAGSSSR